MRYDIHGGVQKIKTNPKRSIFGLSAIVFSMGLVLAAAMPALARGGNQYENGSEDSNYVVVTGNTSAGENQPGWLFNRDVTTSTPYEFNEDEASIGSGSLYVLPIGANPSDKFIAENFINAPVADVDSISYDFMIAGSGTAADANEFYMNVYANFGESDDLKFYDCRYNVVPVIGSTAGFTTVTFDPTVAYPVTTRTGASASPHPCPAVPADMDTLSPGSNIRMFALNLGDITTTDVGVGGYFDKVIVALSGGTTTYDFELYASRSECKAALKEDRREFVAQNPNMTKAQWKEYHAQWLADWKDCKKYPHGNGDKEEKPENVQ